MIKIMQVNFLILACILCFSTWGVRPGQTTHNQKDPKITLTIATTANNYKAVFAPQGGVISPEVLLHLVLKNAGSGAWICEPASFTLAVAAHHSNRNEKKNFPIKTSGCELDGRSTLKETVDIGTFLTAIAAYNMKGDDLIIKAHITLRYKKGFSAVNISSNAITLHIFVPEG